MRALLCAMLRRPVLDPMSEEIKPERMAQDVLERGPDSLVKVCFNVPKIGKTSLSSSPANRVFDVGEGIPAKKWILALGTLTSAEILHSHHISDEALQALIDGDHARFVTERAKTLMATRARVYGREGSEASHLRSGGGECNRRRGPSASERDSLDRL